MAAVNRPPVYFMSHGGPATVEDVNHPAHRKLAEIGKEITTHVRPKAIVVFSAHWESERNKVEVNTAEITDLVYDFYNFPPNLYQWKYPHTGSKEVAAKVLKCFQNADIDAEGVTRGLDHGVWVPFYCAFHPEQNPLKVPIVQVSIFGSDDPDQHHRLGQAVESLRDEGILIIASGMAVHNLRELGMARRLAEPRPYATTFDSALKEAVETNPAKRRQVMAELLNRSDARRAHPSFEHLLPIYIGAGAAGEDSGKQLWTLVENSVSWAQYRFGELAVA